MCCIIHRPVNAKEISSEYINNIIKINTHGWGIAYLLDDGKVEVFKSLKMEDALDKIRDLESKNKEFIFHARRATHGDVTVNNCHPYNIGNNNVLFHNGTIKLFSWNKKMSDTWHFSKKVSKFLKKKKDVDWIFNKFKKQIGDSRLCIFNNNNVIKYGFWHEIDGCYYSKVDWRTYNKTYYNYGHSYNNYRYYDDDFYNMYEDDEYSKNSFNDKNKKNPEYERAYQALSNNYFMISYIDDLTYSELFSLVKDFPLVFARTFKDKIIEIKRRLES